MLAIKIITIILFLFVLLLLNVVGYNAYKDAYKDFPKWFRIILFIPPFTIIGNILIIFLMFINYIIDSIRNI